MLRRIVLCIHRHAGNDYRRTADARRRRPHRCHAVFSCTLQRAGRAALHAVICSVLNRGPCIPEIDYPDGENLQLTIESVPSRNDAAKYQKPDHDLDTIGDLFAALRSCWSPPPADFAREDMQMSVRFSFKRSGEIIAAPRVTYATAGVPADIARDLSQGDQRVARRLHAAQIHRRARRRAGRAADRDPLCR